MIGKTIIDAAPEHDAAQLPGVGRTADLDYRSLRVTKNTAFCQHAFTVRVKH